MLTKAAFILFVTSLALPAAAQDKPLKLPKNTIDCAQFKKTGPQIWVENGTAVFNLGGVDDINLTNQPVIPGYFRFDGIDLFPVLEQKCGAAASEAPATGQAAAASTALAVGLPAGSSNPEPEQQKPLPAAAQNPTAAPASSPAPAQKPAPAPVTGPAPALPVEAAKREPEGKCQDRKSVYAADSLAEGAGDKAIVEIAFETKAKGEAGPDFILRESKSGEVQWSYKGRTRQGRFIFAAIPYREVYDGGRFAFASMPPVRNDSVTLQSSFIKPSRDGFGEPILAIHGLRSLFASKEDSRRFKFEGKRPAELLPEAYYFDRCE